MPAGNFATGLMGPSRTVCMLGSEEAIIRFCFFLLPLCQSLASALGDQLLPFIEVKVRVRIPNFLSGVPFAGRELGKQHVYNG